MSRIRSIPVIAVIAVVAVLALPGVLLSLPAPAANVAGTPGDDQLVGTARADRMAGLAGADVIHAGRGADVARGGPGDDLLYLGRNPLLEGPTGDSGSGGPGDDVVIGGDDGNAVYVGPGRDRLYLGAHPADAADQAWGPVKTLARNPRGEALAVDAAGTVTIVWAQSSAGRRVMALRRPAGGDWGTPVVVGRGYAPQVAADEAGNLTAVWLTQRRDRSDGVMAAQRPAGGRWSDPVRLTRDVSVPGYVPDAEEVYGAARVDLAASPGGDVVVVWDWGSDPRDVPWRIRSAYQPAGEAWGKQVDVTPASGANSPQVGVSADGAAVLVYGRQAFGHPQLLLARNRTPDGAWTRAVTIASRGYTPALAVDRAGDALVVFTPNFNRVQAVVRPAGLPWRAPRNLSPKGVAVQDYAAALNGQGSAVVALARGRGRVDLLRSSALGRWTTPHRVVSGGGTVFDVLVGLNDAGDTFVGWGGYDLLGRYRPAGGAWSPPSTISPDAGVEVLEETFAEVLPAGGVVVLWKQEARPLKVRLMSSS